MSECFPEPKSSGRRVKVEIDFSNYPTKSDLKNVAGVDTSTFAKNDDLASLKSNLVKLDIDKLKNVPTNLNNLKSKVDKLDVDKLVPVSVNLSNLNDVVKIDVVKRDLYNPKMKNDEDKIPDINNLATDTTFNPKINEIQNKIPNITNLATTTAVTPVENKIPNVGSLSRKHEYNTKISETENKITTDHDPDKCITTQEINKTTSEQFTARLKKANLASKGDIS